jgi:hypothetical protein
MSATKEIEGSVSLAGKSNRSKDLNLAVDDDGDNDLLWFYVFQYEYCRKAPSPNKNLLEKS